MEPDLNDSHLTQHGLFLNFLTQLSAGDVQIEDWNRFVVCRYNDPEMEAVRKQLSDWALTIGQCSALPFPQPLRDMAKSLIDQL